MRVVLEIEYDGTDYCGWQYQNNGETIQGEIEKAIFSLTGETLRIHGSGRTDAGVHAYGQIAHFDTDSRIPPEKFAHALNQHLPDDISIIRSWQAGEGFHARFSAKGKHYRYVIRNAAQRSALCAKFCMQVYVPLDIVRMKSAAKAVEGEHDFTSFCAAETPVENKVRTVSRVDVTQDGSYISIDVEGNGFLHNMVRIIAGTLIDVGHGKIEPEVMETIIAKKDRRCAGVTADAKGLFLVEVKY